MLLPIVITLSVVNLVAMSVATTAIVLYASHRIAGPLYRFNQALNAMGGRDLGAMAAI